MNIIQNSEQEAIIPTRMTKASSAVDADGWRYERSLFHFCLKEECPGFRITPNNEEVLNALFYYSLGLDDVLDPDKGLWIWGEVGTGKSTLLRLVASYHRHLSYVKKATPEGVVTYAAQGFRIHHCARVAAEYASYGLPAIEAIAHNKDKPFAVGFDEMGREPIPVKHFGAEMNIMAYILRLRYEHRRQCRTYVTSNLNPEGIRMLYGSYVQDRVYEMFNLLNLGGESFRKERAGG